MWGLDRIDQASYPLDQMYSYKFTGRGVDAYILDSGIRTSHREFGGRARCGINTIDSNKYNCNDDTGHGTHVAGSVGSAKYGVAKHVNLIAVKVTSRGRATLGSVLGGVDYVTNQRKRKRRPSVANMSVSGDGISRSLDDAVSRAYNAGVTFVCSAGNRGQDACNYSPAAGFGSISVAAVLNFEDKRPSWSNYGSCVDIFAPGSQIASTFHTSDTASKTKSGTSMAAPLVAGAAALLLEQYPSYNSNQIRQKLMQRALHGRIRDVGARSPNVLLQIEPNDQQRAPTPRPTRRPTLRPTPQPTPKPVSLVDARPPYDDKCGLLGGSCRQSSECCLDWKCYVIFPGYPGFCYYSWYGSHSG